MASSLVTATSPLFFSITKRNAFGVPWRQLNSPILSTLKQGLLQTHLCRGRKGTDKGWQWRLLVKVGKLKEQVGREVQERGGLELKSTIILQNNFIQNQLKYASSAKCVVRCVLGNQVQSEGDIDEVCELVNGVELVLGEEDSFNAYLLKAVKNNNGAAVLLLSDVFGFEDSGTRDFAYRLSCNGYNVLVPDLYRGEPWSKDRPQSEFEKWRRKHLPERVASDIDISAKWLLDEVSAAGISDKLGIVGFCFGGGRLVETLARDAQSHFGAAVCFYGTRFDPSLASQLKIPVLFIVGENDPLCPVDLLRQMESQIKGSHVCVYASRGHGFAHHPESLEEDEDAEDAFNTMRSWLNKYLVQTRNVKD